MLHPDLARLIREVKIREINCAISSNLNLLPDPVPLLSEGPDFFRVSVSGFTQPVYEIDHRAGNIAKVKRNMERLAEAKLKTGARTAIEVFCHRYRHNGDEIASMADFAHALGFRFSTTLAQIFRSRRSSRSARAR